MINHKPKVGETYRYEERVNPAIISASSMSPTIIKIKVVAMDDKDVWYKRGDRTETKQTSIERFMSIVSPISTVHA